MPTVSSSLQLFDRFSQTLNRAQQGMQSTLAIAGQLKRTLEAPMALRIDMQGAMAHVDQIRQRIAAAGGTSALNVVIDANAVVRSISQIQNRLRSSGIRIIFDISTITTDAQRIKAIILSQIGNIRTQIQIQLPASLTVMFTNIQRLVMRLLVAVRQLSSASNGTQQLQSALQRIAALEEKINRLQQQLNSRMREGGSASGGMMNNLKGMAAAYLSIATLHKGVDFIHWADSISSVNTRLSMINDGTQTQLELQQKVMGVANDTRQSYQETASMIALLGAATQGVFKTDNEILDFASRFNKLIITGGSSADDSKRAILQMSQALSSGVLQGDELRSLSETAPMLMKVLADGLGVSRGSLKKLGAEGKLTSSAIVRAFANQDAYIDQLFSKMPVTFGQAMTLMKNKAAGWISTLNGENGPIQRITKSFMKLVDWMDTAKGKGFLIGLGVGLSLVADGVEVFTDFIVNNMGIVRNVLLAIGIVVVALAAKWLVMWAIAAWPVFAIIGAIALVLTALNRFGVSTQEVVGAVAGFFNSLFALIWNSVGYVWNFIISFAEFLVNIFIDPVYAIKKLFYDMVKNVIGYFTSLIDGITENIDFLINKLNEMPGVNIGTIGKVPTDWVESLKPETDKNVVDFSKYKMQYKDINDAYQSGNKYGQDLFTNMANALDGINQKGDAWSNIDKVNEVGKIKDKVDISSEDLKTMRELAEMKNIQNFVTLTPQVSFGDTHVKNESDMQSIITNLKTYLEGELVSSVEGVYE